MISRGTMSLTSFSGGYGTNANVPVSGRSSA